MDRRTGPAQGAVPRLSGRRAVVAALLSVPLALATVACDPDVPTTPGAAPSATTPAGNTVEGSSVGTSTPAGEPGSTSTSEPTDAPTKADKPSAAPKPVPSVDRPRAKTVGLEAAAEPAPGLTARLVDVEDVAGTAEGPGETAGDALRVTVELTNATKRSIDLRGAVVNLYTGKDRLPTSALSGPGLVALPRTLAQDDTVRATYVFRTDDRDGRLEVEVDIADAESVVVFRGTR
ncbi:hypothetical protein [Sanguibacter sp. HDW7]|uniref:hypothetical protein n=1 Tax=Sanguibacter sp. HDW7 TaxID=2714931 RepID=UPI001409BAC9|nr:hypothetical protein [Sanguibacter sp. HDW7]QIK84195.1 hypothetical protein G7063_11640 [Sanguibacter sp. HDW7]